MKSYVVVMKGKAKAATTKALQKLNPKVSGNKILIKPNLASRVRNNGENTDIRVVEGVVEYFQDKGDITVAEGCCGSTGLRVDSTYELFEFAGYSQLENKYGIKLLDLNSDTFEKVRLCDKMLGVAKTALDADYLISVPVLKTHVFTTISACVKNLMGCLQPKPILDHETATKWEIHAELSRRGCSGLNGFRSGLGKFENRLIALYRRLSPKLGVVDAIVASQGDAPVYGTPVNMDLVISSADPISCDAVAAYLIGIDQTKIGYLRKASELDLGKIKSKEIDTNVSLQCHRKKLRLPSSIEHLL